MNNITRINMCKYMQLMSPKITDETRILNSSASHHSSLLIKQHELINRLNTIMNDIKEI